MGIQQLMLLVLGLVILGVAIAIGLSLFSAQHTASNRDALINDLNHLGAVAYQFRGSLRTMGGGEGSYSTFVIPSQMRSNDNGTFLIDAALPTMITFRAIASGNPSNTIVVNLDSNGRLGNWTYGGDFF
jgi:hypothetical protein